MFGIESTPRDREVYEETLRDFLPDAIVDCHVHLWTPRCREGFLHPDSLVSWPDLVAADCTFEDLEASYRAMFPGKKVRAVLMTNIASIAAMMPLAMAMSEGSEMRQPMAIASVGGLAVSTLMAVFLIPALYWAVPSVCGKLVGLFRRKKAAA